MDLSTLPTYTPRAVAAWRRLLAHKPFLLKTKEWEYFVDRGGYATPLELDGCGPMRARGQSVKASTLLDPDKKPDATRRR